MVNRSRPRTGSLQYYPHGRAQKETPSFRSFSVSSAGKPKAVNFFGYKAGMIQLGGKNLRKATPSSGHDIVLNGTVIECPPVRVFGIRAMGLDDKSRVSVLTEISAEKTDRHLLRRMHSFHQKKSEKKKKENPKASVSDLEKIRDGVVSIRLLVHTQPSLTNFGKKKPDVSEIALSGKRDDQIAFAKEKLGSDLRLSDVFDSGLLVDVKAVSKGKGMQGVIKRHNVKMQRHKAKITRVVGSIGPWHPPTVMWTVARPGHMGYNSRTEFNKKILMIGEKGKPIAPDSGFPHYGVIENDFVVVAGSVPGPSKRCVALRIAMRPMRENRIKIDEFSFVSSVTKPVQGPDEIVKKSKILMKKEEKKEHASVEQELQQTAAKQGD